uniref:Uncharacterized protein n=1 Tax=Nelumbo nucifera TaxID=4432 RepID=A0A822Z2G4_NELNU|nr:TPA_asm: hypothetical protein HUJ06_008266 [Nelumbo nucifera]
MYYDVGTSYTAILARGNSAAFITGFMTFLSVGGFPSFIEEMKASNLNSMKKLEKNIEGTSTIKL